MSEAAALNLLADIRAAVGDPHGRLMQDELVEHCKRLRTAAEAATVCVDYLDLSRWSSSLPPCMATSALVESCRAIQWPEQRTES